MRDILKYGNDIIVSCHLKAGLSESRRASIATQQPLLLGIWYTQYNFNCWKPESPQFWVDLRVAIPRQAAT
jgi:hypothetical protein